MKQHGFLAVVLVAVCIPAFGQGLPTASREITIKHLLTHTSGLTYNWNADLGERYRAANVTHEIIQYDRTIADSVRALAGLPLLFNPGDKEVSTSTRFSLPLPASRSSGWTQYLARRFRLS